MKHKIVGIYSVIHFIVDLSCAILVTNLVTQRMGQGMHLFAAILLYNLFAFAMQLPIGMIADAVNKNAKCSAIGCLLVAFAFGLPDLDIFGADASALGFLSCLIAGTGNAMFHIGGGIDVLCISDKKASLPGIFVSTGAMGIFLGSHSASIKFDSYYLVVLILLVSSLVLFNMYSETNQVLNNKETVIPERKTAEIIAIICFMATVCIRSYVGLILSFGWKSNFWLALLSVAAVVFGKVLGGVIGDRIGFKKIAVISLTVSAVCFLFAFEGPFFGIMAILFFNMTMPITLTALSNILHTAKGLAFGLLTFALFLGAVPEFLGYTKMVFTPMGLFVTTLISAVILYIGIHKYDKVMVNRND